MVNHNVVVIADRLSHFVQVLWVEANLVVPINGKGVEGEVPEELHVFQFLHDA